MSEDTEAHSHQNIQHNGETYIKLADAAVTFRHLRAEITRLRAALATARREGKVEGIEWAAGMIRAFTKIAEKMADDMGLERSAEKAVQFAVGKVLEEAAAIRAALGEER